jgi:hypothetical protein
MTVSVNVFIALEIPLSIKGRGALHHPDPSPGGQQLDQEIKMAFPRAIGNVVSRLARKCSAGMNGQDAHGEVLRALRYTPFRWQAHRLLIKTLIGYKVVDWFRPLRDLLVKLRVSVS